MPLTSAGPGPDRPAQAAYRRELAAVFAGGFAGAIVRADLADALSPEAGGWPWPTFLANVAGAFLLGYVATLLRDRGPGTDLRLRLLGTGFCGALTTFSTLQFELLVMLDDGDGALAAAYLLASVAAGLAAVVTGDRLARRRHRRRRPPQPGPA